MYTYGNVVAGEVEFPLSKLIVEFESIVSADSGRDDAGKMHLDDDAWIKPRLRKLKCTIPPSSQSDISRYLDAVMGKVYNIEYIDPILGLNTVSVYTSQGSAELYNARLQGGLWYNVTFNAIEMG